LLPRTILMTRKEIKKTHKESFLIGHLVRIQ